MRPEGSEKYEEVWVKENYSHGQFVWEDSTAYLLGNVKRQVKTKKKPLGDACEKKTWKKVNQRSKVHNQGRS